MSHIQTIEEKEKRAAAFHETGHAFICALFDGFARAKIWRNLKASADEKTWRGACAVYVQPSQPILFGLAGVVAEHIANGADDIEIACSIADAISLGWILSKSDMEKIGDDWTDEDVFTVVRLLRQHWEEIEMSAEALMSAADDELAKGVAA